MTKDDDRSNSSPCIRSCVYVRMLCTPAHVQTGARVRSSVVCVHAVAVCCMRARLCVWVRQRRPGAGRGSGGGGGGRHHRDAAATFGCEQRRRRGGPIPLRGCAGARALDAALAFDGRGILAPHSCAGGVGVIMLILGGGHN
eukprot:1852572-Pleurochrysis_carterae.AAC.1